MKNIVLPAVITGLLFFAGCAPDPVNFVSPEEQLQMDLEAIDKYLADNSITAVKHPSGLRYVITQAGSGAQPNFSHTITVRYTGRLLATGTVFDQQINNPVSFPLRNLIMGWQIAFPLLNRGTQATLFVPSGLGYGPRGSPPAIPANANLIFDVELVDFR
jgi:FKBP-type peptidyl-prolyl cis-trans isomerase